MNIHTVIAPVSRVFRQRRMRQFVELFSLGELDRIIDIGGYKDNWLLIDVPGSVVLVNVDDDTFKDGRFEKVQGDGRRLAYAANTFDIAYSNSVIEHVGSWDDQKAFAAEVRRVAPRYYVQTPNRRFPLEMHVLAPFVQYIPKFAAKRLLRWITPWGWIQRPSPEYVAAFVESTRLLTETEMRALFPEAKIIKERVFGLTKSLIAVRV